MKGKESLFSKELIYLSSAPLTDLNIQILRL